MRYLVVITAKRRVYVPAGTFRFVVDAENETGAWKRAEELFTEQTQQDPALVISDLRAEPYTPTAQARELEP